MISGKTLRSPSNAIPSHHQHHFIEKTATLDCKLFKSFNLNSAFPQEKTRVLMSLFGFVESSKLAHPVISGCSSRLGSLLIYK
ncbi:hypothetical protein MT418_8513 [Batrachochytrium dendrobatidis]